MKKRKEKYIKVGAAVLILDEEENVLLLLRKSPPEAGSWTIPGGHVEFMERLEETIIREVKEEVGVEIEIKSLLCVTEPIAKEEESHWVSPVFLAQIKGGQPENLEPEVTQEINWFSLDNLPEKINITTRAAISIYLKLKE